MAVEWKAETVGTADPEDGVVATSPTSDSAAIEDSDTPGPRPPPPGEDGAAQATSSSLHDGEEQASAHLSEDGASPEDAVPELLLGLGAVPVQPLSRYWDALSSFRQAVMIVDITVRGRAYRRAAYIEMLREELRKQEAAAAEEE